MSKTDLDGAVVVITGGGRGIGRATASAFADRGARVVIGDLDEQVARQAANDIGRSAHGFALDVASRESYTSFLETVKREVGPIDVLVNNAGIMPAGAFADTTLELVRATIDVNLWGVMLGCHLVLPDMMSRGHGHIINVASLLGRVAGGGVAAYCGTKFGVFGFTDALQQDLRCSGVTATVVLPGVVRTELSSGLNDQGPVAEPADVAAAIVRACDTRAKELNVPKWSGSMRLMAALTPRLRHPILHKIGYDRALHGIRAEKRTGYSARLDTAASRAVVATSRSRSNHESH